MEFDVSLVLLKVQLYLSVTRKVAKQLKQKSKRLKKPNIFLYYFMSIFHSLSYPNILITTSSLFYVH